MICTICQEDKDPSSFRTLKSKTKNGVKTYHMSSCKSCNQEKKNDWRRERMTDPAYAETMRNYRRAYRLRAKNDPVMSEREHAYQKTYREKKNPEAKPRLVFRPEDRTSQVCFLCKEEKNMHSFRSRILTTGRISYETRCKVCQKKRDRAVKQERKLTIPEEQPIRRESIPSQKKPTRERNIEKEREKERQKWARLKADPVRYAAYLERQRKEYSRKWTAKWETIKSDPEKLAAYREKNRLKQFAYQKALHDDSVKLAKHNQKVRERLAKKKDENGAIKTTEPARKAPAKRKKMKAKARRSSGSISSWLHKMAQQR